MNRRDRRRQAKGKTPPPGGAGRAAAWQPPNAGGLAGALMGYAEGKALSESTTFNDPDAEVRIGIGHFQSGRLDLAQRHFERVLQLRENDPTALQMLGVMAHQRGDGDVAVDLLSRAIAAAPDYADAYHNLGVVLLHRGEIDAAADHLDRAVTLKPSFAEAVVNLGNVRRLQGRLDEAEASYRRALTLRPDLADARVNLANVLKEGGQLEDALSVYDELVTEAPGHAAGHSNRGECLVALGREREAIAAFRRAAELAPDDVEFANNLRDAMSRLLPAWHLPMLADTGRNDAYDQAIRRQVKPGARVLDIGTGTGLLAMMAARAGAGEVHAVEMNADLADAAGDIVVANGFADRIHILNRRSFDLHVGDGLPGPADVIIAEVFDAGLLGEGAIPTLRHAANELLADGGVLLPRGATVHAMLVDLPRWRSVNPVGEIAGFDLSAFDRFRNPAAYRQIDLARETHTALSAPFRVATFDFADLPVGERWRDIQVPVVAAGTAHAVAFWFDLALDDEVTLSGAPGGTLDHWQQAVQFFDQVQPVGPGQTLSLTVGHTEARIYFEPKG